MTPRSKKVEVKQEAVEKVSPEGAVSALENLESLPAALRDRLKALVSKVDAKETSNALLATLKFRFEKNPERHEGVEWAEVEKALAKSPESLASLWKLEETGGEPQVVGVEGDEFIFGDRSAESPFGRRNLTFDQADTQRKSFGPDVRFQSPDSYRAMQKTGEFDLNSWSWLETDAKILEAGDAMHGHRVGGVVGVRGYRADFHDPFGGWRASLRVKKA